LARLAACFLGVALMWVDGGYASRIDSNLLGWAKDKLGLLVETVKRTDDIKGFRALPRRWVGEWTLGWLIRNRRLARDYERLTDTSEAMITIVMIRLMTTSLAGQSTAWANTIEREALRRMKIETRPAA
jgi:hypothetical protein